MDAKQSLKSYRRVRSITVPGFVSRNIKDLGLEKSLKDLRAGKRVFISLQGKDKKMPTDKEVKIYCDSNVCRRDAGKDYSTGGPVLKGTLLESIFKQKTPLCKDCNSVLFRKAYRFASHNRRHTKVKEDKIY